MSDHVATRQHRLEGIRHERHPWMGPIWVARCSCGHESQPQAFELNAHIAWTWHLENPAGFDGAA